MDDAWKFRQVLRYGVLFAVVAYFLAPAEFELSESLKNWVGARLLRDTGRFPVLHAGPLYNLYLQFFLSFDYPLSVQLEHAVTHLFALLALLFLLRRFLPALPALMLTCAWIPSLWVVEGGVRVLGLGCIAVYLAADRKSSWAGGPAPVPLVAAAAIDSFFIAFLLGHLVGVVVRAFRTGAGWHDAGSAFRGRRAPWVANAAIVAVVVTAAALQSNRPDNNVHGIEYPWSPVALDEALTAGSVQFANWRYVMMTYPESEWGDKDWYVTHREAFGGARTIVGSIANNPTMYLNKMFWDGLNVFGASFAFLTGWRTFPAPLSRPVLLLWPLLPLAGYWVARYFRQRDEAEKLFSMTAGIVAATGFYALVHVSDRWMMPFLPLGVLAAAHLGLVLRTLPALARTAYTRDVVMSHRFIAIGRRAVTAVTAALLAVPFVVNPWVLGRLLALDGSPSTRWRIYIAVFDAFCLGVGMVLLRQPDRALELAAALERMPYPARPSWLTVAAASAVAVLVFTASRPHWSEERMSLLARNPYRLDSPRMRVRHALMASLAPGKRVLASEDAWIKAFGDVETSKVYNPLYLPPFKDTSGATDGFLEGLDVIWVSQQFASGSAGAATQVILRYKLHVEPFLRRAVGNGWTAEHVDGFGDIYRRSS